MRPALLILLLLSSACSPSPTEAPPTEDTRDPGERPTDPLGPIPEPTGPLNGEIAVLETLWLPPEEGEEIRRWGQVRASFYNGAASLWHQVALDNGTCQLKTFTPAFCDTYCNGVCVRKNECVPWPTSLGAGTLTLRGLPSEIKMAFDSYGYLQPTVPSELFAPETSVTLSASGGQVPAFELQTWGVTPIEPSMPGRYLTLTPGQPYTLRWAPSGEGARVRVTLRSPNSGHGQPLNGIIECDVADSEGEVTIPADMIDAFPRTFSYGACVAVDCPPSSITRYSYADARPTPGRVLLVVGHEVVFGLRR